MSDTTISETAKKKARLSPFWKGIGVGVLSMSLLGGIAGWHSYEEALVSEREMSSIASDNAFLLAGIRSQPNYDTIARHEVFKTEGWKEYVELKNAAYSAYNSAGADEGRKMAESLVFPDLKERMNSLNTVAYESNPDENIGLVDPWEEMALFTDISRICAGAKIMESETGDILMKPKGSEAWAEPLLSSTLYGEDGKLTDKEKELTKKAVLPVWNVSSDFCLTS